MEDMFDLFRRHHGNVENILVTLGQPRGRSIYPNEGGKFLVETAKVPPFPKRSIISKAYYFGKWDQNYGNEDQCKSRDQEISTKFGVS